MEGVGLTPQFWSDRSVLVTGHTGFKGAWLCLLLEHLGAAVHGLSIDEQLPNAAFLSMGPWSGLTHTIGDIRDPLDVVEAIAKAEPSVILHLAAQSLVREGYRDPWLTLDTNVLGTVRLLQAAVVAPSLESIVIVTSDKVYMPSADSAHSERDRLGGFDPYSGSKAAVELIVQSLQSTLVAAGVQAGAVRSGNIVGGGDRGRDRLLPDVIAAVESGTPIRLRNPSATRPWQFVLEPLRGYLSYAEHLCGASQPEQALNFGPGESDPQVSVEDLTRMAIESLGSAPRIEFDEEPGPPENPQLSVDPSMAQELLGWRTEMTIKQAVEWTMDWYQAQAKGDNMRVVSQSQLERYLMMVKDAG